MPANILNLPCYAITSLEENEHDYHISAESINSPTGCSYCQSTNLVGFGRREQLVKDLPMHGRRVGLYISTRRMKCRGCNKTFSETLPEVDAQRAMTQRLVVWIGKQAVKRTFASIAEEVGVVEGTVRAIFRDYVAALEDQFRFETPKWMGIDEIHLIKPRCVISNVHNNTIVNLLPNRDKKTVIHYLYHLDNKEAVQYVAMDMWAPYRDAVTEVLPSAQIIIDKFHVVKMANEALEKVRKSLREQLTPKQRRGLMHDRFVLFKHQRDLTDKEHLLMDGWTANYPNLGRAYALKEEFYGIYDADSPQEATRRYEAWKQSMTQEDSEAFADLTRAWSNWNLWILGYFDHPVTNAYTESLNSLIRVMNRLGRGYSFEALRAKILFAEGAHKHKNSRPKFERKARETKTVIPDDACGCGLPDFAVSAPKPYIPKESSTQQPRNYGVDISTLTALIEAGDI
ncbi:ISL3 family transposase [Candidatus Methylospira mobilis]|uniref:ISL3 family transposase n=1 Tax=Candidatus Methylospira mobilis TaxID=1808979 RepID=UPI0028EE8FE9|nr:ISL3 family transposase [Candidatus Methylospira mobilis]WNV06015.1 ISL3 family transposase [Candidatus Methylospira mobilis]